MGTKMDCVICYDKITKSVTCAKCSSSCCQKCFQTNLLNSPLTASCMHCRTPLSDDFILDNTKLLWRTHEYKTYKENLMMDMEKARLPDTQQYAAAVINARNLIVQTRAEEARLAIMFKTSKKEEKEEVARKIDEVRRNRRHALRAEMFYGRIPNIYGAPEVAPVKKQFVKACIATECKGFMNEDFECPLCSTKACKDCHESLIEGHTCNPDVVANVKALAKEARPCPTCAANISKIDGCDQMWCTQCQTTFSWRTGLKETGHTHNPHYYEFMRRNGGQLPRAPGDAPMQACGMPTLRDILTRTGKPDDYDALTRGWANYLHRQRYINAGRTWPPDQYHWNTDPVNYTVIEPWPMPEDLKKPLVSDTAYIIALTAYHQHIIDKNQFYVNQQPIQPPDNHVLRVKYMLGEIDEPKMRVQIQRLDKAYRKDLAKRHVYEMVYQASSDIYRNMLNTTGKPEFHNTYLQLIELLTYANGCFNRLEKVYTCTISKYNLNPFQI